MHTDTSNTWLDNWSKVNITLKNVVINLIALYIIHVNICIQIENKLVLKPGTANIIRCIINSQCNDTVLNSTKHKHTLIVEPWGISNIIL